MLTPLLGSIIVCPLYDDKKFTPHHPQCTAEQTLLSGPVKQRVKNVPYLRHREKHVIRVPALPPLVEAWGAVCQKTPVIGSAEGGIHLVSQLVDARKADNNELELSSCCVPDE